MMMKATTKAMMIMMTTGITIITTMLDFEGSSGVAKAREFVALRASSLYILSLSACLSNSRVASLSLSFLAASSTIAFSFTLSSIARFFCSALYSFNLSSVAKRSFRISKSLLGGLASCLKVSPQFSIIFSDPSALISFPGPDILSSTNIASMTSPFLP